MSAFCGVKVFCATMVAQRQVLGEQVTRWLEDARARRPGFRLVDVVVTQSSDDAFHCISLVLFFQECLPSVTKANASADIPSKEKTATSARTAISNADDAAILPTSASAHAPKRHR